MSGTFGSFAALYYLFLSQCGNFLVKEMLTRFTGFTGNGFATSSVFVVVLSLDDVLDLQRKHRDFGCYAWFLPCGSTCKTFLTLVRLLTSSNVRAV